MATNNISKVCKALGVSRGQYYYKPVSPNIKKIEEEKAVINCFEKLNGNYGCTRIRRELLLDGIDVSEYRISKILKKHRGVTSREAKNSIKGLVPWEGQYLDGDQTVCKVDVMDLNYLGRSDMIQLKYGRGRAHVYAIIEVATGRIVGWTMERK